MSPTSFSKWSNKILNLICKQIVHNNNSSELFFQSYDLSALTVLYNMVICNSRYKPINCLHQVQRNWSVDFYISCIEWFHFHDLLHPREKRATEYTPGGAHFAKAPKAYRARKGFLWGKNSISSTTGISSISGMSFRAWKVYRACRETWPWVPEDGLATVFKINSQR